MAAPPWLTARPVAHRGLHGLHPALVENSLGAVEAAVEAGFPVEVDLRLSADAGLAVFHDATLKRLTGRTEAVRDLPLDELRAVPYLTGEEAIASLDDLFALVSGRTPLVLELKSPRDLAGCRAMVDALGRSLSRYGGPVAAMSFDPDLVEMLARALPALPRGIVAGEDAGGEAPRHGTSTDRFARAEILHAPRTRPDFIAYAASALPRPGVWFQRRVRGRPVLAWTVRSQSVADAVRGHADQIIFEGFLPAPA